MSAYPKSSRRCSGNGTAALLPAAPMGGAEWQPTEGPETHDLLEHVFPGATGQPARRSVIDASVGILSRSIDPDGRIASDTGLVIGHVQSGKTLSFTTVSALARDNRFPDGDRDDWHLGFPSLTSQPAASVGTCGSIQTETASG